MSICYKIKQLIQFNVKLLHPDYLLVRKRKKYLSINNIFLNFRLNFLIIQEEKKEIYNVFNFSNLTLYEINCFTLCVIKEIDEIIYKSKTFAKQLYLLSCLIIIIYEKK